MQRLYIPTCTFNPAATDGGTLLHSSFGIILGEK